MKNTLRLKGSDEISIVGKVNDINKWARKRKSKKNGR